MTVALWCVLAAGTMPYVATLIAKSGRRGFDNRAPRDWLARQEGFRKRANAAQLNSFEAFPLFAAAVIVAHLVRGPQSLVDLLAILFVVLRLLYLACYLANQSLLRSTVWFAGLATVVAIFVAASL